MSIRVDELLSMTHLRLELRAGQRATDRSVTWAQASDLDHPWEWMTGGELLMKNGRSLAPSADGQIALFEEMSSHNIAALVLGIDPDTPPLRKRALMRADALPLAVITAPYSVGFGAIGRAVAEQAITDEARRAKLTGRIYDVIRRSVSHPTGAEPLKPLERDLACRLAVLDAETGTTALDDCRSVPDALRCALVQEVQHRGGALPGVIHLDSSERALAVEVPDGEPTVMVAYGFRSAPPDIVLLQHMATAAAVLLAQQGVRREHERRLGAEIFAQILDRRIDESVASAALQERGLSPSDCVLVAAHGANEASEKQVHVMLHRRSIPNLLMHRSGLLYALLPNSRETIQVFHRRLGARTAIGVSDPRVTFKRAAAAAREANWAVRDAISAPGNIVRYADSSPLSALRDTEEARMLVNRILGELLRYDSAHGSEMVRTLDLFLTNDRSWQRTATMTGVHRQTVVYRMRRVEEITGRDLSVTGHIADFWLALRARDILSSPL